MPEFGPLVSTAWLAENLDRPDVKTIDASWRMPGSPPARGDYDARHINGAVFFDIDAIADRSNPLPHMLPTPAEFEAAAGGLGVSHNDRLVIYDDQGIFSAARVWWTFRAMGHGAVAVLNGGLPKWRADGGSVTSESPAITPATYKADPQLHMISDADDIRAALNSEQSSVVDARPAARFFADAPEPRAGLRSGRMPGAHNLPFGALLNDEGTMRAEIATLFADAGADLKHPVITTCGSGVAAAVLSLALETIGHRRHSLYDGSWTHWGDEGNAERDFPVTAGKG
ncbi:MAG: 3-mercaptopyruvate sulfurtransferase [Alphaproteobacteria bacterium]|nr:3-mercaptopyruvate sulfurtransferase [Alphaproteobacteria bacterium]